MSPRPAIRFERVSKSYLLGFHAYRSLRGQVSSAVSRLLRRKREPVRPYLALDGVSFEVGKGESLGIIGPNGAGKSTCLKLAARITWPSEGIVEVEGRVASLIEVGTGFHLELTGRQNVYLNGSILGMSRREVAKKFDRILEFSGIGEFIDTPVKKYSSGMYARLGFSVAAHLEPDVFLVDEVLSVGDFGFQQKCIRHMEELRRRGTTIVFVSHNLQSVASLCDRGILIDRGKIVYDGDVGEAISRFNALLTSRRPKLTRKGLPSREVQEEEEGERACTIEEVVLVSGGRPTFTIRPGEETEVRMTVLFRREVRDPGVALHVHNPIGVKTFDLNTARGRSALGTFRPGERVVFRIRLRPVLVRAQYRASVGLVDPEKSTYLDWRQDAFGFFVENPSPCRGIADLGGEVEVERT